MNHLKKHNKVGRFLYFAGIVICSCGIAFKLIDDTPETLSFVAIPFIIAGIILLISSNFFRKQKKQ